MKAAQHLLLAMATLCLSGCVALNRGSLARAPRPAPERTLDLDAFVTEHNRNAELVQSLKASPTIGVKGKVITTARADGRLAFMRQRNFSLQLRHQGVTKGNIGSNDEEFWFWVQNDNDKSIYWCDYAELEASALAMTYQPDWIIEALGLQPISSEEAAHISLRNKEPGATALVFPPVRRGSETYTKMMIVSNYTLRLKELRIYAGNVQSLLAQAEVSRYADYEAGGSESGGRETCYLPESVRLDWKREQLVLDVLLQEVTLNQFDSSRAAAVFAEPVVPGYKRVNLAELSRAQQEGRTTVRRTTPPPEPGGGREHDRPGSLPAGTSEVPDLGPSVGQSGGPAPGDGRGQNGDGELSSASSRRGGPGNGPSLAQRAAGPGSARGGLNYSALKPNPLEDLVLAPLPIAPESRAMQAANAAWSGVDASPIGR
jgi:hypothetical protein